MKPTTFSSNLVTSAPPGRSSVRRDVLLRVSGLKVVRGRPLLELPAWTMLRGEHWVVLGPNGCGKTTLLQSLLGFLSPTAGEVELLGRVRGDADWAAPRREVGWVSTSLGARVEPGELVSDCVLSGRLGQINLWATPKPADHRAALAAARACGVERLYPQYWSTLSQGERQRVLLARALAAGPRLLFLDEPCAGLDPVARAELLGAFARLAALPRGPGLVLVTHHVEEITPGFTHALVLAPGKAHASGPLEEVLTSKNLSAAYQSPVKLRRGKSGWSLEVKGNT